MLQLSWLMPHFSYELGALIAATLLEHILEQPNLPTGGLQGLLTLRQPAPWSSTDWT